MNGNAKRICNTVVGIRDGSPSHNKAAISIGDPSALITPTLVRIARGVTTAAVLCSSTICAAEVGPTNAYTAPKRVAKTEYCVSQPPIEFFYRGYKDRHGLVGTFVPRS